MNEPLKVFITYSHKDADYKEELRRRLAVMEQQGMITLWDDNEILPGDEWYKDISDNLTDSDILLYLVSASSLVSKNCNKELGEALGSDIRVIPIILESCDWQNHQLRDNQALPDKGKPINEWDPESKAWQNVADGIRKVVNKMQAHICDIVKEETLSEWVFQQGNFLMTIGQMDRAIEAYSHAIELNPLRADIYNNRGVSYFIKGEYEFSISDYNKAINLNSSDAVVYNNRGNAYHDKGDFDRAITDYAKAIDLDPRFTVAYNNRGNTYASKGDIKNAIADYSKVIDLEPDNAEAYFNRGSNYRTQGGFDRAIADYTKAIDLNPEFAAAYNNRGNAYCDKGGFDRAIADYTKAIDLNPEFAVAYNNRGSTYCDKGDLDHAITDHSKAIDLNPDYAEAYNNRGNAYIRKGGFDRAIADYTKAIDLNPEFAVAYNNRGSTYVSKGGFDRAIADYTKAIDLNPNSTEAYFNRGICHLYLQNWQEAKTDLLIAKKMRVDIIAIFRNTYGTIEAFNRINNVQLPKDITVMLTQRRRSRFSKKQAILAVPRDTIHPMTQQQQTHFPETQNDTSLDSPDVVNLRERLCNSGMPLTQYVKARSYFGIRTGRDEVFVVDSATRDELIAEHPSSADILKPFLHGRDIRRWQVEGQGLWLIFAYRGIEISSYPAIQKHLKKYRDSLGKRTGEQKWYELQAALGDSKRFTQTKLVCPNLYNHQTFAVETDGFYCGHTCYLIPTEETWLCGVLNSRVVEWFYSQVSDQLTGDKLRAISGYMQQIPIPDITSTQKELIGKIVDYLIYLQKQPTTNSKDLAYARDYVMLKYFERIIDGLVYESYLSEELHQGGKHFFEPLSDEQLPQPEEIQGDKMSAFRDIFEHLYEKTHPIRKNLFFLDSLKSIRIIEGKA